MACLAGPTKENAAPTNIAPTNRVHPGHRIIGDGHRDEEGDQCRHSLTDLDDPLPLQPVRDGPPVEGEYQQGHGESSGDQAKQERRGLEVVDQVAVGEQQHLHAAHHEDLTHPQVPEVPVAQGAEGLAPGATVWLAARPPGGGLVSFRGLCPLLKSRSGQGPYSPGSRRLRTAATSTTTQHYPYQPSGP